MNQDIKIIVVHNDSKNDGEIDFLFENLNRQDKLDIKVAISNEMDIINKYSKKIENDNLKRKELEQNIKEKTYISEFYDYTLDRYEEDIDKLNGIKIDYNNENYELLIKLASYFADKGEIIIFNFKKYLLIESPISISTKQRESLKSLTQIFEKEKLTYLDKLKIKEGKIEALKYKNHFGVLIDSM